MPSDRKPIIDEPDDAFAGLTGWLLIVLAVVVVLSVLGITPLMTR